MSPPNFKSQLTDLSVKEDEQLQLDVSLDSAQPGTTVKWYVNGKELQQSPDVQVGFSRGLLGLVWLDGKVKNFSHKEGSKFPERFPEGTIIPPYLCINQKHGNSSETEQKLGGNFSFSFNFRSQRE